MNIFVGNLPFSTTDEELKSIFEGYGDVESAKIIMDRETGRSRGFGFVEMNDESAKKAIDELHESDYQGKNITVNEARPKKQMNRGGGGFNNRGGGGFQKRW